MKRRDEIENDALLQFIDSGDIEKAPEGFTSRVMENIRVQPSPEKQRAEKLRKAIVPSVSTMVTIALVIAAIVIPESSYNNLAFIESLKDLTLPSLNLDSIPFPAINIPGWIPYVLISVFLLLILDRALSGLFHRNR